jgi:hypothetical protein
MEFKSLATGKHPFTGITPPDWNGRLVGHRKPLSWGYFQTAWTGIRLAYGSGMIINLCGTMLKHGVSVADGQRI